MGQRDRGAVVRAVAGCYAASRPRGNARRGAPDPVTPRTDQVSGAGLQIVDNLHPGVSNRNMLKPDVPAGPSRAVPRDTARGAPPAAPSRNGANVQPLRVVQSSSLAMLVQRELERSILAGELAAGSKLNE